MAEATEKTYAVTIKRDGSRLLSAIWKNAQGELDRDDGPAVVVNFVSGICGTEEWWQDGRLHREDGPARLIRDVDGQGYVQIEEWYRHGLLHRDHDEPASIHRDLNGLATEVRYAVNGELHRISGPALVRRSVKTGRVLESQYWQHGRRMPARDRKSKPSLA